MDPEGWRGTHVDLERQRSDCSGGDGHARLETDSPPSVSLGSAILTRNRKEEKRPVSFLLLKSKYILVIVLLTMTKHRTQCKGREFLITYLC